MVELRRLDVIRYVPKSPPSALVLSGKSREAGCKLGAWLLYVPENLRNSKFKCYLLVTKVYLSRQVDKTYLTVSFIIFI